MEWSFEGSGKDNLTKQKVFQNITNIFFTLICFREFSWDDVDVSISKNSVDLSSGYLSSEDLEMSDCRELRFRREESRLSLEPESSAPVSGTGRKKRRWAFCRWWRSCKWLGSYMTERSWVCHQCLEKSSNVKSPNEKTPTVEKSSKVGLRVVLTACRRR